MLKIATLATAIITAMTVTASAHESSKPIDRTMALQARQIEDGRKSGDLTRREYRALKVEQDRIADQERAAYADGYLSRREARELKNAQKEANMQIRQESNDRQISWYRRWLSR